MIHLVTPGALQCGHVPLVLVDTLVVVVAERAKHFQLLRDFVEHFKRPFFGLLAVHQMLRLPLDSDRGSCIPRATVAPLFVRCVLPAAIKLERVARSAFRHEARNDASLSLGHWATSRRINSRLLRLGFGSGVGSKKPPTGLWTPCGRPAPLRRPPLPLLLPISRLR